MHSIPLHRRPLSIVALAVLLSVSACGAPTGNSGLPPTGDGDGDETVWQLVLPDESLVAGATVEGSSAELVDPNTIVLSDSVPAGWSVTFTAQGAFEDSTFYASSSVDTLVGATIVGPPGTCSVPAGTPVGEGQVTLTTGLVSTDVPSGQGTVVQACLGYALQESFIVGFVDTDQ